MGWEKIRSNFFFIGFDRLESMEKLPRIFNILVLYYISFIDK